MALTKVLIEGTEYDVGYDGPQTYQGRSLDSYSWDDLKNMCAKADFSEIKVGDYKSFTFGSETVDMEVAGIDCYYNTTGAETHGQFSSTDYSPVPHHIDFISRDCVKQTYQWNLDNHNCGTGTGTPDDGTDQPFLTSYIKKEVLDGVLWDNIPEDLKKVIIPKVNILERRAYNANTPLTESTGWHWYNMGKLWLPTEFEVFGTAIWSNRTIGTGQQMQYPIFANSWKHRIKHGGKGGSRCGWWLCSVRSGDSTNCCGVYGGGFANYIGASYAYGVPICFRIAAQNKAY